MLGHLIAQLLDLPNHLSIMHWLDNQIVNAIVQRPNLLHIIAMSLTLQATEKNKQNKQNEICFIKLTFIAI